MRWKRWKLGLLVACLTGLFGAVVTLGVVKDIGGWQQFVLILAVGISKDAILFLKQHPVDSIQTDTDFARRPQPPDPGSKTPSE